MSNSAKAILFDADNRILVLWRSGTHPHYAHHLDLPGGLIEAGESPAETVAREILEETGLHVSASDLELVNTNQPHSGSTQRIFVANLNLYAPEITISWEHESYQWLTREEFMAEAIPINANIYHHIVIAHLDSK